MNDSKLGATQGGLTIAAYAIVLRLALCLPIRNLTQPDKIVFSADVGFSNSMRSLFKVTLLALRGVVGVKLENKLAIAIAVVDRDFSFRIRENRETKDIDGPRVQLLWPGEDFVNRLGCVVVYGKSPGRRDRR